ncbi:MAG: glycosyltransferase [Hyphomicrobiaceae bacterium]
MRIAFHAPLNAPERGKPSGDRLIGRMLMRALIAGGHEVALATPFRSYDKAGDDGRQQRIATLGQRLADRLTRRLAARPKAERPHLWLTYHLYHKAPDHIGPRGGGSARHSLCGRRCLGLERQATGPWRLAIWRASGTRGGRHGARAQRQGPAVLPHLRGADRYRQIRLFIDTGFYRAAAKGRREARRRLGARTGLGENPILVAVGMMRAGAKLASYRLLADALSRLTRGDWGLVIVGGGPEEGAVRAAFAGLGDRIAFLGEMTGEALAQIYAGADPGVAGHRRGDRHGVHRGGGGGARRGRRAGPGCAGRRRTRGGRAARRLWRCGRLREVDRGIAGGSGSAPNHGSDRRTARAGAP